MAEILASYSGDHRRAIRLLSALGSESAAVVERLQLTRKIASVTLSELKAHHGAQINLMRILSGVRFKHAAYGLLVPMRCSNRLYDRRCVAEDSCDHLVRSYRVEPQLPAGPEAIPFLTIMAKRARPDIASKPRTMYIG